MIREERDQVAYPDYIHLNPVEHGCVADPRDWRWSSVYRHLRFGWLEPDWSGYAAVDVEITVR